MSAKKFAVHCKNKKCHQAFPVSLETLSANRRRAVCPHCNRYEVYDVSDLRVVETHVQPTAAPA